MDGISIYSSMGRELLDGTEGEVYETSKFVAWAFCPEGL